MHQSARSILAVLLLAPLAAAQSLYGVDALGNAAQFTGPPAGPCGYPGGPLLGLFSYVSPGPCPTPKAAPAAPSDLGDVAVDDVAGTVWITDGLAFAEYQSFGSAGRGFHLAPGTVLAGAVTGQAFDPATGGLWITDGALAAQVLPPPTSLCKTAPAQVLVAPFALPIAPPARATDIDHDPVSGTLWICDDAGHVINVLVGGGLGPAGAFFAPAAAPCNLGTGLAGLSVDRASNGAALYVSDGALVVYLATNGSGAAPATFYTPAPCSPPETPGLLRGLAFSAPPIGFGKPSGGTQPFFPVLGAIGRALVPNPSFALQVAGAQKGELVSLFASSAPLCPPLVFGGVQVFIAPAAGFLFASAVAPASGLVTFPLPIPPGASVGASAFLQALTFDPTDGSFSATGGLAATLARR